jgi:hypothetical protein
VALRLAWRMAIKTGLCLIVVSSSNYLFFMSMCKTLASFPFAQTSNAASNAMIPGKILEFGD